MAGDQLVIDQRRRPQHRPLAELLAVEHVVPFRSRGWAAGIAVGHPPLELGLQASDAIGGLGCAEKNPDARLDPRIGASSRSATSAGVLTKKRGSVFRKVRKAGRSPSKPTVRRIASSRPFSRATSSAPAGGSPRERPGVLGVEASYGPPRGSDRPPAPPGYWPIPTAGGRLPVGSNREGRERFRAGFAGSRALADLGPKHRRTLRRMSPAARSDGEGAVRGRVHERAHQLHHRIDLRLRQQDSLRALDLEVGPKLADRPPVLAQEIEIARHPRSRNLKLVKTWSDRKGELYGVTWKNPRSIDRRR